MNSNTEKNESGEFSEFQVNLNLLRDIDFFSGLPLDALKVFAYLCTQEVFMPGQYLFHQNDDDGSAYYVISGTTTLCYAEETGEAEVRDYREETFFGSLSILTNMHRLFSLKAKTEVRCMVISRQKFQKAIGQFPGLMPRIIKTIANRITRWEKQFILDHAGNWPDCRDHIGISLI
ncbi:MAG: cyclic nucleotide-binding domain-containing protein [Desulfobacteraceae bacterium]|nr:cyclic nucleotide-binding domain-containing protein [Desulfobacteraceae bacterium]